MIFPLNFQKGFTLLELMIAVAIIGVTVATALPIYQQYMVKSKLVVAFSEANMYRIPYETLVNEGSGVTDFSPAGLNMPIQTRHCQFSVTSVASSGNTTDAVKCSLINIPSLSGEYIGLDRTQSGKWLCTHSAGIESALLPTSC